MKNQASTWLGSTMDTQLATKRFVVCNVSSVLMAFFSVLIIVANYNITKSSKPAHLAIL